MTEEDTPFDLFDESSRRSFMKKGALASSAAALGLSSTGTVASQQEPNTALVFVNDYRPDVQFEITSRLQQTTVNQILGGQNGDDGDGAVSDPTDYNGYIYNYTECGPGNYNLVFVRDGTLEEDQSYTFGMDATFFSDEIQLLEVGLGNGGGGGN